MTKVSGRWSEMIHFASLAFGDGVEFQVRTKALGTDAFGFGSGCLCFAAPHAGQGSFNW